MAYEDVIAAAPPEVQAFAERLVRWVEEHRWSTGTTKKGLTLLTPEGVYICRFQPTKNSVEVDLRRFRRRGLDDVADDLAARMRDVVLDPRLTKKSVQVPIGAIDRRWDAFFDDFLPVYVAEVEQAERDGPDPGD